MRLIGPIAAHRLRTLGWLLPIFFIAACSQQGSRSYVEIGADGWRKPTRYYPPPGPPNDPWGPYIREASGRYRVPERWVRAVMRQESGGREQATSSAGAMGLMQVMPATYEELRVRHGLGDDPYDPHNNVLAGTAYMRDMYDRFGAPGFLAAYNAGPDRVESYLAGRSGLPQETVNYMAAITPNLGNDVPRSGPFAKYASARSGRSGRFVPSVASLAAGCDLNAAYSPSHPCTSLERAARQATPIQTASAQQEVGAGGCDLNLAYDPNHPCNAIPAAAGGPPRAQPPAARQPVVQLASAEGCDPDAAYNPARPCRAQAPSGGVLLPPPPKPRPVPSAIPFGPSAAHADASGGEWAIQVGAFASPGLARSVAEGARAQAPHQLSAAVVALPPTASGGAVLYRARLAHLSAVKASNACKRLNERQLPCIVVPPGRS